MAKNLSNVSYRIHIKTVEFPEVHKMAKGNCWLHLGLLLPNWYLLFRWGNLICYYQLVYFYYRHIKTKPTFTLSYVDLLSGANFASIPFWSIVCGALPLTESCELIRCNLVWSSKIGAAVLIHYCRWMKIRRAFDVLFVESLAIRVLQFCNCYSIIVRRPNALDCRLLL